MHSNKCGLFLLGAKKLKINSSNSFYIWRSNDSLDWKHSNAIGSIRKHNELYISKCTDEEDPSRTKPSGSTNAPFDVYANDAPSTSQSIVMSFGSDPTDKALRVLTVSSWLQVDESSLIHIIEVMLSYVM